jgi:hypothetical protein
MQTLNSCFTMISQASSKGALNQRRQVTHGIIFYSCNIRLPTGVQSSTAVSNQRSFVRFNRIIQFEAGLKEFHVLNEPTAAANDWHWITPRSTQRGQVCLVCDTAAVQIRAREFGVNVPTVILLILSFQMSCLTSILTPR